MDKHFTKTVEKVEGNNDISGNMAFEEPSRMYLKEKSLQNLNEDHDMKYVTDILQYDKVSDRDLIDYATLTSSGHFNRRKARNTKDSRYKCDECGYKTGYWLDV